MPRVLISPQYNPYLNIAVENYLLSQPSDGDITMYLWKNRRTVVIGQNQNPFAECNVEQLEKEDGFVMRRRTGGGAVYHDLGNLNFSFIVPYPIYDQSRQFSVLQQAVAEYGLTTEVSGRNDVLCQGRKFSGNAFSKGREQRLHHGTILIKTDVEVLQKYLKVKPAKLQKHGVASVQSRVVNLSELNIEIDSDNIIPKLIKAFEKTYGSPLKILNFEDIVQTTEVQQLKNEFESDEWKYGRWRNFTAQKSAQFDWGCVDLSVDIDEEHRIIRSAQIACDGLDTNIINKSQQLICGSSTQQKPSLPPDLSDNEKHMIDDILSLIY